MDNHTPKSLHHIRDSLFLLAARLILVFIAFYILHSLILLVAFFDLSRLPWDIFQSMDKLVQYYLLSGGFTFLSIAQACFIIFMTLWAETNDYYIGEDALVHYYGIISAHERIYELGHLRSVTLDQSWLGRLFNYGNIKVVLAVSGYHEEIEMTGIANPKKYERILKDFIQKPTA